VLKIPLRPQYPQMCPDIVSMSPAKRDASQATTLHSGDRHGWRVIRAGSTHREADTAPPIRQPFTTLPSLIVRDLQGFGFGRGMGDPGGLGPGIGDP
jgi:hypothetical protein